MKNNFISIECLLSLQADTADNKEAKTALNTAIGRVKGMSILYDKLLLSENYNTTSAQKYLSSLIDDIIPLLSTNEKVIIVKQLEDIEMNSKQLFTIGLIINELLTNVMKYSFIGRDGGLIEITLKENRKEIILTIQDNGNGLPEGFESTSQKGFGHILVKMLIEQLGGNFTIKNKKGTMSIIKFPVNNGST